MNDATARALAMVDGLEPDEHFGSWPEPKSLPPELLPVSAFQPDLLPEKLRPWIEDIAERMQCDPSFVAVPAMVAAGAVIGRRVAVRPQARTDWTEVPNLWGLIVGRPGVMKSPAMSAALAPLARLAARAREQHEQIISTLNEDAERREILEKIMKGERKKRLKDDPRADLSDLRGPSDEPEVQPLRRYTTSDSSYQALAELLIQNPNGLLVERDEMVSLLRTLDCDENAEARGFYLTGWNGKDSYTVDRIGRGTNRHVEAVTIGMIGGTQPGRLAAYTASANQGGAGDDGLIQRFGMLVWPDLVGDWENVDRYPDNEVKNVAFEVFEHLDTITPQAVGADWDTDFNGNRTGLPFLRFGPAGLEIFTDWRSGLERSLRAVDSDLTPALESHFAKYRKLVPALALICHLADGGTGSIDEVATLRAIAWSDFLMTHARRAYGSGRSEAARAARLILKRTKALPSSFTARDVYRREWSGLTDRQIVQAALELLEDHGYVRSMRLPTGGAPSVQYTFNPRLIR